jgi:hypothetical protein
MQGGAMQKRYRIRVWPQDAPTRTAQKHVNHDCGMCVGKRAMNMADVMAKNLQRSPDAIYWTVETISGHLRGWEVVLHSQSSITKLVKRHAHR